MLAAVVDAGDSVFWGLLLSADDAVCPHGGGRGGSGARFPTSSASSATTPSGPTCAPPCSAPCRLRSTSAACWTCPRCPAGAASAAGRSCSATQPTRCTRAPAWAPSAHSRTRTLWRAASLAPSGAPGLRRCRCRRWWYLRQWSGRIPSRRKPPVTVRLQCFTHSVDDSESLQNDYQEAQIGGA